MKTATLVINDTKKFDNAVFQMQTGNTRANYEGWLQDVIKTLKGIQQYASTTDAITSEEEYTLGDVINFLETIDVRTDRDNPIAEDFEGIQDWLDKALPGVLNDEGPDYCPLDGTFALVLAMEGDFCENGSEYERKMDGSIFLPGLSLRYYQDYGAPEDWPFVRHNDDEVDDPLSDYAISNQNEQAEVLEWICRDLDEHLNIKI